MASRAPHSSTALRRDRGISRRSFFLGSAGLAGAASTGLLTGCGNGAGASGGDGGLTAVDYQLAWLRNIQFAGDFAAVENGYFEDNGIDVDLLAGGPSVDGIAVVGGGSAPVGLARSNEIVVARGTGYPVRAIGVILQDNPFGMMYRPDDPITSLEEMYGRTVAVADSSQAEVEGAMERQGLDPSEVNFVPKSPDPSVLPEGQVDAYWGFVSTEAAVLTAEDVDVDWVLMSDLGERASANVLFATEDAIEQEPEMLTNVLRAVIAGWQWAVDNVEEAAELVAEDYAEDDVAVDVAVEQMRAQVPLIEGGAAEQDGIGALRPDVFEENIELSLDSGLIDEELDVEDVIDPQFFEAL